MLDYDGQLNCCFETTIIVFLVLRICGRRRWGNTAWLGIYWAIRLRLLLALLLPSFLVSFSFYKSVRVLYDNFFGWLRWNAWWSIGFSGVTGAQAKSAYCSSIEFCGISIAQAKSAIHAADVWHKGCTNWMRKNLVVLNPRSFFPPTIKESSWIQYSVSWCRIVQMFFVRFKHV